MNSRAKGRRNELRCKKILEDAGYEVYLVPPSRKWQDGQDIFGLFDVCALNSTSIRLIQVKTNYARPEVLEAISLFLVPVCVSREVWVFKDRVSLPIIKIL